MNANDTKLLPCPFCGGEAKADSIMDNGVQRVRCPQCQVGFCTDTRADAVELWNRRASRRRPIATAPKDGKPIWILDYNGNHYGGKWSDGIKRWITVPGSWMIADPTHWMPLPQPPK